MHRGTNNGKQTKKRIDYDLEKEFRKSCLNEEMRRQAEAREEQEKQEREEAQMQKEERATREEAISRHRGKIKPESRGGRRGAPTNSDPAASSGSIPKQDPNQHAPLQECEVGSDGPQPPHQASIDAPDRVGIVVRRLRPGANVRVRVRAWNEVGVSAWSEELLMKVPFSAPSAPLHLHLQVWAPPAPVASAPV